MVALIAQRLCCEIGKELACAIGLTATFGARFSLLAGNHLAQFIGPCHHLCANGHQHIVPRLNAHGPPFGLRAPRRGQAFCQIFMAGLGEMANHIAGVRWVDIRNLRHATAPHAIDEILTLHKPVPCYCAISLDRGVYFRQSQIIEINFNNTEL